MKGISDREIKVIFRGLQGGTERGLQEQRARRGSGTFPAGERGCKWENMLDFCGKHELFQCLGASSSSTQLSTRSPSQDHIGQ